MFKFSGPITLADYMKECLLHPIFVRFACLNIICRLVHYFVKLPHRATTCKGMCLVKRVISSLRQKSVRSLERYTE